MRRPTVKNVITRSIGWAATGAVLVLSAAVPAAAQPREVVIEALYPSPRGATVSDRARTRKTPSGTSAIRGSAGAMSRPPLMVDSTVAQTVRT